MYRKAKYSVIAKKAVALGEKKENTIFPPLILLFSDTNFLANTFLDDFQGISENSGELFTFKKGDQLTVIGISDDGGYAGTNGRDFARFPAHYVRILNEDELGDTSSRPTVPPQKPSVPTAKKPTSLYSQSNLPTPPTSASTKKALPLKAPPNLFSSNSKLPAIGTGSLDLQKVTNVKSPPPVPPRSPRGGGSSYGGGATLVPEINEGATTPTTSTTDGNNNQADFVLTPKQKHRQEVIKEILTTEKDYVRDLNILTSVSLSVFAVKWKLVLLTLSNNKTKGVFVAFESDWSIAGSRHRKAFLERRSVYKRECSDVRTVRSPYRFGTTNWRVRR